MAKYYTDPATGQRVKIQKSHKIRNFVVLPGVGLVALIVVISAASGGGGSAPTAPVVPASPVSAEPAATGASYAEVFGTGEAMVTVMTDGSSTNTVKLPHRVDLPEGFATVSVSRGPSMESYMQNGGPDSGEVGCRIVRDGKVVDEKKASGQFASASCTKFM
ncbi:hypothetical protein HUO13_12010 [Saccharopolyspora erythraea]|uniref:hypothetical protein n=1 Tax=Saccharopolyspora erythraea TaxID=1836 RepID=UPI001BA6A565|nr:hypothetical protein [Saccharopolyspora erythraea]QUG99385.1 hypothetical protein HUO13_12010 [Saccharopolyspora erythraea]